MMAIGKMINFQVMANSITKSHNNWNIHLIIMILIILANVGNTIRVTVDDI
jgi:uncharacterized membrane protein AbrB (regulator of aidB expression)